MLVTRTRDPNASARVAARSSARLDGSVSSYATRIVFMRAPFLTRFARRDDEIRHACVLYLVSQGTLNVFDAAVTARRAASGAAGWFIGRLADRRRDRERR